MAEKEKTPDLELAFPTMIKNEEKNIMEFTWNGYPLRLDLDLAIQLNTYIYNITKDFDCVILVTGNRQVRVGKSVIAASIAAYIAAALTIRKIKTDFSLDNVEFDAGDLAANAIKKPKHSILLYDEGREGLAANKSTEKFQKDLLDFFAECGQKNHFYIIVLPDYFELKENMAVARSDCLINCFLDYERVKTNLFHDGVMYDVINFVRGNFQYFARSEKAKLYDKYRLTRQKSYKMTPATIEDGWFCKQYPFSEDEYNQKKLDFLKRYDERKKNNRIEKANKVRDGLVKELHSLGMNQKEIVQTLATKYEYRVDQSTISRILTGTGAEL